MRELSLNVMDVAQNSITAGASLIEIRVEEDRKKGELVIYIIDNGKGMSRCSGSSTPFTPLVPPGR